ncbi:hypothetical protein AAMO2058_001752900, partial [Amorphochlora amoebiformis]
MVTTWVLVALISGLSVRGEGGFFPTSELQDVRELTNETYRSLVSGGVDDKGGKTFHVVVFYKSMGEKKDKRYKMSEKVRTPLIKAAKKLRSTAVMVSAIDYANETNRAIFDEAGLGLEDIPTIKIFSPDGNSDGFSGKMVKLAEIVEEKVQKYVENHLARLMPLLAPKQKVYKAFKKDKEMPKVVLVLEPKGKGKQRKMAYEAMAALSIHFEGRLKFAYTKHRKVAKAFGGGSLPAVFLVPKGEKFDSNRAYTGTLAYRPLRTWLDQFAPPPPDAPKVIPPVPSIDVIPQITSTGCLNAYCVNRGGVCIISLLPVTSLSKGETGYYLESMRLVRRALADKLGLTQLDSINFIWIDSQAQQSWLEKTLGLSPAEYARTVAIYPKKASIAHYIGKFSPPEISTWISQASRGKAMVEPLPSGIDLMSAPPMVVTDNMETCENLETPLPNRV